MFPTSQEDLQRRSKELDLREALLNEKERQLDEAEATSRVEVLMKQIEAKEKFLDTYNDKILAADKRLKGVTDSLDSKVSALAVTEQSKIKYLDGLDSKKQVLLNEITNLRSERDDIKEQIKERKQYYEQQEIGVNHAIADWNSQLTGFQKEADGIAESKRKLLEDTIRLEQDKATVQSELETLSDKRGRIANIYEEKVAEYRLSLEQLDTQVSDKRKQMAELDTLQEIRERALLAREKSVRVKEVVMARTERELYNKEKKLRGDYNRTGLNFDEAI
jgi:chromosome segregation ATPase